MNIFFLTYLYYIYIYIFYILTFRIQQKGIPGILKSENTDILGNVFIIYLLTNIHQHIIL